MNLGDIVKHRMTGEKFLVLEITASMVKVRRVFKWYGTTSYDIREFYAFELVKP